jgi:hypothetical protein
MGGLQDEPGHRGHIHAAARHGYSIGSKNQPQRPLSQDGAHPSNVIENRQSDQSREIGESTTCAKDFHWLSRSLQPTGQWLIGEG